MEVLSRVSIAHEDGGLGVRLRPQQVHVPHVHLVANATHDPLPGSVEVGEEVHGQVKRY